MEPTQEPDQPDLSSVEELFNALSLQTSANNKDRTEAYKLVEKARHGKGYVIQLLKIITSEDLIEDHSTKTQNVCTMAAIELKNTVEKHLKNSTIGIMEDATGEVYISETEWEYLQANLIPTIGKLKSEMVTKLLLNALKVVQRCGWKCQDQEKIAYEQVDELLSTKQPQLMLQAIWVLYQLVGKYQYEFDAQREPLNNVFEHYQVGMFELIQGMLDDANPSIEVIKMAKYIMKYFYVCNNIAILPMFASESLFNNFLDLVFATHNFCTSDSVTTITDPTTSLQIQKLQKSTLKILKRLYQKYSNINYISESTPDSINKCLCTNKERLAELTLTGFQSGQLGTETLQKCMGFYAGILGLITKEKDYMVLVKDRIERLLTVDCMRIMEVVIGRDIEKFEEDPVEFVKQNQDFMNFTLLRYQMRELFVRLFCYQSIRGSDVEPDYLKPFLIYFREQFTQHPDMSTTTRTSLIFMLQETAQTLENHPEQEQVKSIMDEILHPIIVESSGIELFYALEATMALSKCVQPSQDQLKSILSHVDSDNEAIQAVFFINLSKILDHPNLKGMINIGVLIEKLFKSLDKVQLDDIGNSLVQLIGEFEAELKPHTKVLLVKVTQHCLQFVQSYDDKSKNGDDCDNEIAITIMSLLQAISAVVSMANDLAYDEGVETCIIQFFQAFFDLSIDCLYDYVENLFDILSAVSTMKTPTINYIKLTYLFEQIIIKNDKSILILYFTGVFNTYKHHIEYSAEKIGQPQEIEVNKPKIRFADSMFDRVCYVIKQNSDRQATCQSFIILQMMLKEELIGMSEIQIVAVKDLIKEMVECDSNSIKKEAYLTFCKLMRYAVKQVKGIAEAAPAPGPEGGVVGSSDAQLSEVEISKIASVTSEFEVCVKYLVQVTPPKNIGHLNTMIRMCAKLIIVHAQIQPYMDQILEKTLVMCEQYKQLHQIQASKGEDDEEQKSDMDIDELLAGDFGSDMDMDDDLPTDHHIHQPHEQGPVEYLAEMIKANNVPNQIVSEAYREKLQQIIQEDY